VIVAIFGLGEAGSLFAADLVAVGVRVQAFDPKPVATPLEVVRCDNPRDAVLGATVVLALTPQDDAIAAFDQARTAYEPGTLYADLSTSAPAVKREIAAAAAAVEVEFVDVALMSVVPGHGMRAPALVSGDGADRYVATMVPFGVPVESVGPNPGDAATRKLLRSVMMKGLAALVIEAMRAAGEVGLEAWLWGNLVDEITAADGVLLARLVKGTGTHAVRRLHEMEACQSLLESLGVDPVMTRSTVETLRRVPGEGVPVVPPRPARAPAP
jgi:3-hydroxyisobutyrate dehydrogenase-like beta-hydroxyacid dehydrogenase